MASISIRLDDTLKAQAEAVLDAMGLRRREMVKTLKDNAATRGMIASVSHLVEVIA